MDSDAKKIVPLERVRAIQIEQGHLWDELDVRHLWIHIVRGMVQNGEIAKVGAIPFCVYVAIKAHTDLKNGDAWPGIPLLSKQVGVSEPTVERAIRKLKDEGYLKVTKHGRRNMYEVIEKIPMVNQLGDTWATGERKYVPTQYSAFVDELKRIAKTGNLATDKAITINVTFNVQNITQADGGTVTMNVQNVNGVSDDDLKRLLQKSL